MSAIIIIIKTTISACQRDQSKIAWFNVGRSSEEEDTGEAGSLYYDVVRAFNNIIIIIYIVHVL